MCIPLCFLYGIPYRILTNKKSISCTSKCYGSLMPDLYTVSLWTHKTSNVKRQLEKKNSSLLPRHCPTPSIFLPLPTFGAVGCSGRHANPFQ